ncbi:MAG TPA: phosphatase PAP2 family protein [Xanthobacteraceae bacterium]|jgi:membrane-associated PAP2 superfamily phosphatase
MNRIGLAIALVIAATVGIVFAMWPELDLKLVTPFFDTQRGEFTFSYNRAYLQVREISNWLIALVALPAALAPAAKLFRPDRSLLIPGRAILLMLLTLALVPGFLADVVLKKHWGRPRPIDVAQFGGQEHFRPWWDPRGDCPTNCSFIAGEPSGAFWTMSAAAVAPPQWRAPAYAAALLFGAAVGLMRMAAGAHFFTDVVFSGVFAFLAIWVAHGWLYRWRATRISDAAVETALERLVGKGSRKGFE